MRHTYFNLVEGLDSTILAINRPNLHAYINLTLEGEITRILHFRVPKSANSCFTQLSRHIAKSVYYKTWVYTPQKDKNV